MDDPIVGLFQIAVLLFSVVIHEIAHGAVALAFGDTTARDAGRLTLNPLRHLDPFGSLVLPLLLLYVHAPVFGWAKPVPYNPFSFRRPRFASACVGVAGPLTNVAVAGIFTIALRALAAHQLMNVGNGALAAAFASIILVNLFLGAFNLIPLPPLDGSKLLFAFIPDRFFTVKVLLERYGIFLFIFLILLFANALRPLIMHLYFLLVPQTF